MLLVNDFIEEKGSEIRNLTSFKHMTEDRKVFTTKLKTTLSNDMVAKKILSNEYGNSCDMRLARIFRDWVRNKIDNSIVTHSVTEPV